MKITIEGEDEKEIERKLHQYLRARYQHVVLLEGDDDAFKEGLSLLRAWYQSEIEGLAGYFRDQIKSGHIEDRDSLDQEIHETVDGCGLVIYTGQAQATLLCSQNDSVSVEEGLLDLGSSRDGVPWSALAYGAVRADILEELERLGVDVNDDNLGREEEEDEEEEEETT